MSDDVVEMTVDETEVSASQADSSDDDDYDDDDVDDDDDKEWLNDSGDVNQFTSTSLLTTRQVTSLTSKLREGSGIGSPLPYFYLIAPKSPII